MSSLWLVLGYTIKVLKTHSFGYWKYIIIKLLECFLPYGTCPKKCCFKQSVTQTQGRFGHFKQWLFQTKLLLECMAFPNHGDGFSKPSCQEAGFHFMSFSKLSHGNLHQFAFPNSLVKVVLDEAIYCICKG